MSSGWFVLTPPHLASRPFSPSIFCPLFFGKLRPAGYTHRPTYSPWCVVGGPFRGCAAPRSLGRVLFWFFSVVCVCVWDVATRGLWCTLQKHNGRLTDARPQDPRKTTRRTPIAAPTTAVHARKGLLMTDLLPTYGKRNQCVVCALRPHFRKLSGRECQL